LKPVIQYLRRSQGLGEYDHECAGGQPPGYTAGDRVKKWAKARSEAYLYDRRKESDQGEKSGCPAIPRDQAGEAVVHVF
jgi:hypothetical protein